MTAPDDDRVKTAQIPHVRRTTDQIKEKWLIGDYTPAGYLVELFAAMKKEGWTITIPSVAEFCKEWEIGERTFYRAKAKLINEGRMQEKIKGILEIKLIRTDKISNSTAKSDADADNFVSPTDSSVSDGDRTVSDTPSKPAPGTGFQKLPDLFQIPFRSSLKEREEKIFETELFDSSGEPISSYREWLIRRAQDLPQAPALLELWIEKQALKKANQKAFLKFQASRVGINIPPSPPVAENGAQNGASLQPDIQPEIEPETLLQRLKRYQSMWSIAILRKGIRDAIAAHPDWGFIIGQQGPELLNPATG